MGRSRLDYISYYDEETLPETLLWMSEDCERCVYSGGKDICRLCFRFRDAEGDCRCFHAADKPFEKRPIDKNLEKEEWLLRVETIEFAEIKMYWFDNVFYSREPLLYHANDMGMLLGLEDMQTECFLLENCKKPDQVLLSFEEENNGLEDWYLTADGVRKLELYGLTHREDEKHRNWMYSEWQWIKKTYLGWAPLCAKNFFTDQALFVR